MQRELAIFQNFQVALPVSLSFGLYFDVVGPARKLQRRWSLAYEFPVHINFRPSHVARYRHLAISSRW